MKKAIYFHIGMPKTGSTSIQHFLFNNKVELQSTKNLLYPLSPFGVVKNIKKRKDLNIQEIDNMFYKLKNPNFRDLLNTFIESKTKYEQYWKKIFLPIINNSNCQNIVFSDEMIFLSIFDTSFLDIFNDFDIKIIVYIRKPVEYLASFWAEIAKIENNAPSIYMKSLKKFIHEDHINYNLVIKLLEKLGKDNVIIKPFEKEQWKNNDLIDDFLSIFGIEHDEGFVYENIKNPSNGRNISEIHSLLKLLEISDEHKEKFIAMSDKKENIPIIETVSDEDILAVTEKWEPKIDKICELAGIDKLFINKYPSCYGKERKSFDEITISLDELELLHAAIKDFKELR